MPRREAATAAATSGEPPQPVYEDAEDSDVAGIEEALPPGRKTSEFKLDANQLLLLDRCVRAMVGERQEAIAAGAPGAREDRVSYLHAPDLIVRASISLGSEPLPSAVANVSLTPRPLPSHRDRLGRTRSSAWLRTCGAATARSPADPAKLGRSRTTAPC
mgnify:CR=1 FL=1|tara:strand:+ start:153 stop:632 length:480 start_codon:yes stop_codon:yes gene_type:complete